MSPAAVVFDLDGTLVDSAPDLHAAAAAMLAELGRPTVTLAQVTGFIGNGVPRLVTRCLEATGGAEGTADGAAAALACFHRHYGAAPAGLTRPYPGAEALLRALAARGTPLGLCTNKPEGPARAVLAAFGLGDLFGAVVGGDTLPVIKPDPSPLRLCLSRLGVAPREALYVGDSETDAATASAAGVPFALFTRGYRHGPAEAMEADHVFDDFGTLGRILGL